MLICFLIYSLNSYLHFMPKALWQLSHVFVIKNTLFKGIISESPKNFYFNLYQMLFILELSLLLLSYVRPFLRCFGLVTTAIILLSKHSREDLWVAQGLITLSHLIDHLVDILISVCNLSICPFESMILVCFLLSGWS